MQTKPLVVVLALSLSMAACGGGRGGGGMANTDPKLAGDVTVSEVAIFQSVKISLAIDNVIVPVAMQNAPVVAGREALVRVYVTPSAAFVSRPLTAELHVDDLVISDTRTFTGASTDAAIGSTFQFAVPVGKIAVASTYSVAILDPAGTSFAAGDSSLARFPADGTAVPLGAVRTGGVKVTLVPFAYNGDSSGRLPDTSAAQLEVYRQAMYEEYPTTSVDLTVRAPVAFSGSFGTNGDGFNTMNQKLAQLRNSDGAADDEYYYGLIVPASNFNNYCGRGCVTGLSYVVDNARDAMLRVGSGIGFSGADSAETFIHEVGHEHGRYHAPCEVTDPDPDYPYTNGVIGVWGYSVLSQKLMPPTDTDFMSYCENNWISDYTYRALATRLTAVNTAAGTLGGASVSYQLVTVNADGSLTEGLVVNGAPLHGERRPVTLIGTGTGDGRLSVDATLVAHGHGGGSTLFVPIPTGTTGTRGIEAIEAFGRQLELTDRR